jgi:hypothetical protein
VAKPFGAGSYPGGRTDGGNVGRDWFLDAALKKGFGFFSIRVKSILS